MQNTVLRTGFVIGIIFLFFGASMYPSVVGISMKQEPLSTDTTTSSQPRRSNETEYYAVLCACSRYANPKYDLPKIMPAPESKLRVLYDALIQTKNWDPDHIILLLNENATKHNITDALETMSTRVKEDDIFLFTWSGHGSHIPDVDGDEARWDANDTYDEIICPYDITKVNGNFTNVISDDDLHFYFSNIHAKGKCLIFESCLSGGLVDQNHSQTADVPTIKKMLVGADSYAPTPPSETMDVNGNNTIVIMSTLPNTLGLMSYMTFSPLLYSIAKVITDDKRCDKNNDGVLSAEEIFQQARPKALIQSSSLWAVYALSDYLFFKFNLYTSMDLSPRLVQLYTFFDTILPIPIVLSTCFFLVFYLLCQSIVKYRDGYYFLNWPHMQDEYPGELPLVQT
jgi:hypothetical protein